MRTDNNKIRLPTSWINCLFYFIFSISISILFFSVGICRRFLCLHLRQHLTGRTLSCTSPYNCWSYPCMFPSLVFHRASFHRCVCSPNSLFSFFRKRRDNPTVCYTTLGWVWWLYTITAKRKKEPVLLPFFSACPASPKVAGFLLLDRHLSIYRRHVAITADLIFFGFYPKKKINK